MRPTKLATLDEFSMHASDNHPNDNYNDDTDIRGTRNFNTRNSRVDNIEMVDRNKINSKGDNLVESKNEISEDKNKNNEQDQDDYKNDLQEIHLNSPEFVIDDIPEQENTESKRRLI